MRFEQRILKGDDARDVQRDSCHRFRTKDGLFLDSTQQRVAEDERTE